MLRRRKVAGAIRSLVNARDLQLECSKALLMSVLLYGSESIMWREKDRSWIRVVQMNNLRSWLGGKRMHIVPNARLESCVEWRRESMK